MCLRVNGRSKASCASVGTAPTKAYHFLMPLRTFGVDFLVEPRMASITASLKYFALPSAVLLCWLACLKACIGVLPWARVLTGRVSATLLRTRAGIAFLTGDLHPNNKTTCMSNVVLCKQAATWSAQA